MFCPNCSSRINQQQPYCPNCGKNISLGNYTPLSPTGNNMLVPRSMSVRNSELSKINDMISYFYQKQEKYDAYDYIAKQIIDLKSRSKAALVWGIILCAFAMLIFLSVITNPYYDDSALGVISVLALSGGGLMTLFFVRNGSRNRNLEIAVLNYCDLSSDLLKHYCGYGACPVGPQYTNPNNLQAIKRTILSGRADTIKEALNILLEYSYRSRIQDYSVIATQFVIATYRNASCASFSSGNLFNSTYF